MTKKEESKEILNIEKDLEELILKLDDKETENIVKEFYKSVAKFNNYSFRTKNNVCVLNIINLPVFDLFISIQNTDNQSIHSFHFFRFAGCDKQSQTC